MFAGILREPGRDEPRLVWADWLEQQGDPRGAFVSGQCLLARLPEHDPRWSPLYASTERTWAALEVGWTAPLRPIVGLSEERYDDEDFGDHWSPFREAFMSGRGLVDAFHLRPRDAASLRALAARVPLRHAVISPGRDDDALAVAVAQLGLPSLEVGLSSDSVPSVRRTRARNLDGLGLLAAIDLSAVERLALVGDLSAENARALAGHLARAPLRHLSLQGLFLGDQGVTTLIRAGAFDALESLDLFGNNLASAQLFRELRARPRTAPLALGLAGHTRLHRDLDEVLSLPLSALDVRGIPSGILCQRLASSVVAPQLRSLFLGAIRGDYLESIARIPFSRLTRLGFACKKRPDPSLLEALLSAPALEGLVELDLSDASIGDAGVEVLARSPLRRLTRLGLSGCHLTGRGLRSLAEWPGLAHVVDIDLRGAALDRAGVDALVRSEHLHPTRFKANHIDRAGLRNEMYERFGSILDD